MKARTIKRFLIQAALTVFLLYPGIGFCGSHFLKIGLSDEPKTLNIWLASDRWSLRVLSQIYQPLFTRDPESMEMIPWLAAQDPVYDEASISYTVTLRESKWSDGSEITAEDVAFTGNIIRDLKIPRHFSKWDFIKKIEVVDKKTVRFYLEEPMAIFADRTLTTPIVCKKEWEKIYQEIKKTDKPLVALLNYNIEKPVGNGPFTVREWKKGAYLFLEKNKHFFGLGQTIEGRVLGPFIDGVIYKFFGTSDTAILSLKKGDIDMFWWAIQAGYLDDLKTDKNIQLHFNDRSAMYYMGFNLRKPPFNDVNFRRAVAILIDKGFIISRILQDQGVKMDSVVPPGNKFWYSKQAPDYGEGLTQDERIKRAFQVLKDSGYSWEVPPVDGSGKVVKGKGVRLPNGQPMGSFSILTPPSDYDPQRAMTGLIIQEWLRAMGIPASGKPMAFDALVDQVKVNRDFDAFILAYGQLSIDPDWIRNFFHSKNDKVRGENQAGYRNPDFDRISDQSARMIDKNARRKLICDMQAIIKKDLPYIPLYLPKMIEAVRTDRFAGWVDALEGIGSIWSFCMLKPIGK
ncbi:MAG: ABC transporter substrate-binding protein [Deltaproteobacteria bacterium RBG_13_49_15]|nr:MAG: ABC transporter substrate-binding protein [Deltaproteobacteria bacterium RBG_13_49_15]